MIESYILHLTNPETDRMINQWNKRITHRPNKYNRPLLSTQAGISKLPIPESARKSISIQDFQFCFHSYHDIKGIHRTIQMSLKEIKSAIKTYNNTALRTKIDPATGTNSIPPISFHRIQTIIIGESVLSTINLVNQTGSTSPVSPIPPISQYDSVNQFIHRHSAQLCNLSPVQLLELFVDEYPSASSFSCSPVSISPLDQYINNESNDQQCKSVSAVDSATQSVPAPDKQVVSEQYDTLLDIFQ